jgi:hypothetical protein
MGAASERDVVVVGGGPAGSSAAVFTGRYGLDTAVFDRGNAALARSAFLANYLGFPAGVGIETFYELMETHTERAGCERVAETVERVVREDGAFRVETDEERVVRADYVLAAAWYDGSYLRPLGEELFAERTHHGETEVRFDPEYPDDDGRTEIEGLYVASPAEGRNEQAIIAAGNGARVARSLVEDHRRAAGYPEGVAAHYDWLRPESTFSGEWAERDRWREWFENEAGEHDLPAERFAELRERHIDRAFDAALSEAEVEKREAEAVAALVECLGEERVLDAIDDETIAARRGSRE